MMIELEERELQTVLACLSKQPWEVVNAIMMKIGGQMQSQTPQNPVSQPRTQGNGGEGVHPQPDKPNARPRP